MREFIVDEKKQEYTVRYSDLPGEKDPIIMIAGWGCSASFDYPQMAAQPGLDQHRRILVDLLGSGFSDKPNDFDYLPESHGAYLSRLVEELDLENLIVYGHSMGGRVATDLARRLGSRLKGLVLAEGSMKQERFPLIRQGEEAYIEGNFEKYMERLDQMEDRLFYSTARLWTPISLYRSALSMMREDSFKWAEEFFRGQYKKVFILGLETKDKGFDLEEIKKNKIKIIGVENAGHTMAWTMPEEAGLALAQALEYIDG